MQKERIKIVNALFIFPNIILHVKRCADHTRLFVETCFHWSVGGMGEIFLSFQQHLSSSQTQRR